MLFLRSLLLATVSAAGLLAANKALAATPFTTYAFPATGSPTSRTLPDRIGNIKNVRDFGAVGDWNGTTGTDDLSAIMAAFRWTVANNNRGTLYFPPGAYYVSGPIDLSNTGGAGGNAIAFYVVGCMGASTIVGNFADYVIKRAAPGSSGNQSGLHVVEKLTIINSHASGGGIRMGTSSPCAIRDCDITANFGISTSNEDALFGGNYWGSLETTIDNTTCRAYTAQSTISTGFSTMSDGQITNCIFKDYDTGARTFGGQGGMSFQGCRFEANNIGFANDLGPLQTTPGTTGANAVGGVTIFGCYFKNNKVAVANKISFSRFSGVLIEAVTGSIPGGPQHGINSPVSSSPGNCLYGGILVVGQYQVAGILIGGGQSEKITSQCAGVTVNNTGAGVNWTLPNTAFTIQSKGCNFAPVYPVAQLPARTLIITAATWSGGFATITTNFGHGLGSQANISVSGVTPSGYNGVFNGVDTAIVGFNKFRYPLADPGGSGSSGSIFFTGAKTATVQQNAYEGDCYNVSDSATATWGGAETAGGGANHVKVRYTPTAWTVLGK